MKKIILTIILAIYSSSAFAGSCPMLWGELDGKIAKAQELETQVKKLMMMEIILNLRNFSNKLLNYSKDKIKKRGFLSPFLRIVL